MYGVVFRRVVCLVLILSQFGCRSVYRFRCTSHPSEAGILIADEMMGETPCDVDVPKNSEGIQDGKVEFTFCLPDGRRQKKVVDLSGFKPSNPLAEFVAAPFFLAGGGMLVLASSDDDEDDDDTPFPDDKDKHHGDSLTTGLAGIGVVGIGLGVYGLLGGKSEGMCTHKVHVDFDEPEGKP